MSAGAAALHRRRWGTPAGMASAPGRVNLIGEHTDYSLLPVLPMAIDRRVEVAASPASDGRVVGISSEHGETAFPVGSDPLIVDGWGRYLAAAVSVAGCNGGVRVAVHADLPSTGGLASSSALMVACLAAIGRACGGEHADLVGMAVDAERLVGVEGGAMDQTVIVHATAGTALRIDFRPAALRTVPVPDGLVFVAASSGESAPKGTSARDGYNERVVATRAAAALLADRVGAGMSDPPVLADVAGLPNLTAFLAGLPVSASVSEVAAEADIDPARLCELTRGRFPEQRPLPVRDVAAHVLEEAGRVDAVERAMLTGDLAEAGRLLDESHRSLIRFGVSTGALDRLVEAMRRGGALGARLTGAGFGGYALAGCRPADVDTVVGEARRATGGPAFAVAPSEGIE